ncbi:MAG: TonB-dependent receptor [Bacteroidota bacterium]
MKKVLLIALLCLLGIMGFAQKAKVKGGITDSKTKETMVGVNVFVSEKQGVSTDIFGNYMLELDPGKYIITYKFIGYAPVKRNVELKAGDMKTYNIAMEEESKVLDEVVVSAGRFEQKLSDITVSMEVVKPQMLENTNTRSLETAIQQVPGVMIQDDQASIRGGSGYSYGAGSRVLLTVDEMPMLTGADGAAKWWFMPLENIEQVEVIKGASSALFGSSALNGVVNVRTGFPSAVPLTKFSMYSGFYGNPERSEIKWWGNTQRIFTGANFLHSHMVKNLDIVIGANLFSDPGYREYDAEQRIGINGKLRYRFKKVQGLSVGLNAAYMSRKGNSYLLWGNGTDSVYRSSPLFLQTIENTYLSLDPYLVYFNKDKSRHSLRMRYYQVNNITNTNQNNKDDLWFGEYQYQHHFDKTVTWTMGASGSYSESSAEIYGHEQHFSASLGVYTQADLKLGRFNVSLGGRWEGYKLDKDDFHSMPVFRTGINYQLLEHSFLRGSFGLGFRYPTIAERYTTTSAGSIKIFPNPTLKPEKGWNAELGIKQGFKIMNWSGYIDIAGFWTEYRDMIEFQFGQHFPDSLANSTDLNTAIFYTGFKAFNVGHAQISGVDISVAGRGSIYNLGVNFLIGYTYTNPITLSADTTASTHSSILKYRNYGAFKGDVEVSYKKLSIGMGLIYFSNIINIDRAFEDDVTIRNNSGGEYHTGIYFLPGLKDYRQKHNDGEYVLDGRVAWQINPNSRFTFVVKNILNREYMIRPGDVQAPRSFVLQYNFKM